MRRVRIIRSRRSGLRQFYGWIRLVEWLLKPLAERSRAERECEYAMVRNTRLRADTELKRMKLSKEAEAIRRLELLNIEKMQELGIDTTAEKAAFGNGIQQEDPHY